MLCSLGALWSCDRKIWPISIKIRQEVPYLSAQGWNRQVDVSWLLCWRIGQTWVGRHFDRPLSSDRMIRRLRDCTECFSSLKHPPDGFIPVLRDRQFLGGFWSISAISCDRMLRRLPDCTECFSSLFFTFWALQNLEIQVPTRPTSLVSTSLTLTVSCTRTGWRYGFFEFYNFDISKFFGGKT